MKKNNIKPTKKYSNFELLNGKAVTVKSQAKIRSDPRDFCELTFLCFGCIIENGVLLKSGRMFPFDKQIRAGAVNNTEKNHI